MLIAGNWKMNGDISMANELARAIRQGGQGDKCEYLVCPPFTALPAVAHAIRGSEIALGGQDCHPELSGAHTGDVSVAMLNDVGCKFVIVGHSERRSNHDETNDVVKAKAETAIACGLKAIVCVGESEVSRDAGEALMVVGDQLKNSLPDNANPSNTVIAYEPIWAIGTGRVPSIEQISEMHIEIQGVVAQQIGTDLAKLTQILYGGSVNPENAPDILATEAVGGALVGGASLKAESFLAIGRSCP
tara:strand:+ start:172 stop:909 length:738 start_codon:yes stop_codon:yes gene_type:complete